MDAHEIVDYVEARLGELKQRTDSSPLHDSFDQLVADARALVDDAGSSTPTGEAAPQPGPP